MESKIIELNEANQKLSELMKELQSLERDYDEAITHSANYLGNNELTEQSRGDRVMAAHQSVQRVKEKIATQVQLVAKLAANY